MWLSVFKDYSAYYDLLYQDKDYATETAFIVKLLNQYAPNAVSILDVGCGTGRHASLLAENGYLVHGIDLSAEMIDIAVERQKILEPSVAKKIKFIRKDIRSLKLNQQFDAIVSLFHVMSYQTSDSDLESALAAVSFHLKPHGVFVFDFWYGPAVLADTPHPRVKQLENDRFKILRHSDPELLPKENCVDVNYRMSVTDKINGSAKHVEETHRMRYLFMPEIKLALTKAGLGLIDSREWLTNLEPSTETWGVYAIAQKVA